MGEWLYGSLIQRKGFYPSILFPIPTGDGKIRYIEHCVDSETICQYTGLKDKNGKEIYEGDIVQNLSEKKGYVAFLQQEMGYVVVWDSCDVRLGHRARGGSYDHDLSLEVIGNIYDNKEYLEE